MMEEDIEATFVIVGGGIAGVSCAEVLSFLCPEEKVVLITATPLIKAVSNAVQLTKMLTQFDVKEKSASELEQQCPSVRIITDMVTNLDSKGHCIHTKQGKEIKYKKLCICTGGHPKLIQEKNPYILGIRDTESVQDFQNRIRDAKRIVVVGNGGIATELVYEITGVEIIWVIKDKYISATFVDPGAAEFFLPQVQGNKSKKGPVKRMKYTVSDDASTGVTVGAALGPDWHSNFNIRGSQSSDSSVKIEFECEVKQMLTREEMENVDDLGNWPAFVELTNGKVYGCDLIVSATGVVPNVAVFVEGNTLGLAEDGGIQVNEQMESSLEDVFAAGDVCTAMWERAQHWIQMRLWTQARQMGMYAAKCMDASLKHEPLLQDFCFELFSHVTKFFGYKVILLGLFNGQFLGNNYEILLRVTKGHEYIKLILKDGKLQGAVIVGETDLEEMCENLILDQIDLTPFGDELLNPDIDIDDYFD